MKQLELLPSACKSPLSAAERRFRQFHGDNPHIYERLLAEALKLRRHGHRRYGVGALFERLRYHSDLAPVTESDPYRLNHDYRSRYARLLMAENPALIGFFEIRSLKS